MELAAFDFFCGAGGLTRGLLDAGITVLAGFDADGSCAETYERNNSPSRYVEADIRTLAMKDLRNSSKGAIMSEMLFVGCAPCQPFTKQVKNGNSAPVETLLGAFGRLIEMATPRTVLMENVPGIARVRGNSTFKRFLRCLESNGYLVDVGVLDAKKLGVPQTRRRLILIAMRGRKPTLPKPISSAGLRPYRTVRQAIGHFPPIEAGESHLTVPNHTAASLSPTNLERIKHTPKDGGDRRSWPPYLRLECHNENHQGHTDVYGRMRWDAPAPTLTGRCNSLSNGRYGHPTQDRAISLREAAALQSFPDRYVFSGTDQHIAKQIGNAVPVALAKSLGEHILKIQASS
ncbi:MAG: DNA cytosine methyltransferase [Nitrospirae bacterium]|nr:DNA cytosine methyltransferase [Nitrospirota bacterium]